MTSIIWKWYFQKTSDTEKVTVTKIVFIIKNSIKILFIKINIEGTESKIVFPNININKIAFDDYFLKMNVTKILFDYLNVIQIALI